MTKKTINELDDGESTRTNAAVVPFEEGGSTFKGSIRPNPPEAHYVQNDAQLETALGSDRIIPTNVEVTIIIDKSFTVTKPFKKQDGSSILLKSDSSNVTLTYSGTGALIQMDNPGVDIGKRTQIDNLTIVGNGGNQCLAVEDSDFFTSNKLLFVFFAKVGFIKGASVIWTDTGCITVAGGVDFIDNEIVNISGTENQNTTVFAPNPQTLYSFISTIETNVIFQIGRYVNPNHPDFFVFFDPNSDPDSSFTIRDSGIITTVPDSLFQKGTDLIGTALMASGSDTRFAVMTHGFNVGQYVVVKDYTGFTGYNGTRKVTAVIDADNVDLEVGFLGVDGSGRVNAASLDATNNRVEAFSNPDQQDSMSLAECRSNVALFYVSSGSTFDPIQNTIPITDDFIEDTATESFSINVSTGIITYTGLEPITATIAFDFLLSKVGGGTDNATVSLFNDTTQLTKTDQSVALTSTPQKIDYNGGIFKILPGDTFQLFIDNDSVSSINVSSLKILITRQ